MSEANGFFYKLVPCDITDIAPQSRRFLQQDSSVLRRGLGHVRPGPATRSLVQRTGKVRFDFKGNTEIRQVAQLIARSVV
jgi:hypothetical protein